MPGSLLRAIETSDREDAVRLLTRGFTHEGEAFWRRNLERQAEIQDGDCGYFLTVGGEPIGVMLTLRSFRPMEGGGLRRVVNISSWYVEPPHRWRAVQMLRAALADDEAVHTDLTALPHLYKMNASVGLSTWSTGAIIASCAPFAALPGRPDARILSFAEAKAKLHDMDARMLEWHEREGHTPAVLMDGEAAHPLIFRLIRRKGVRFAQLIFAPSRTAVVRNLPALMRFLMRKGVFFATIDADRPLCPAGAYFRAGRQRFFRGAIDRDRLDYAYSELPLFGVS